MRNLTRAIVSLGMAVTLSALTIVTPFIPEATAQAAITKTVSGSTGAVTSITVHSTVTSSKSIKEQTKYDEYQVRDVLCSFDDGSINRATSEHFQIIWGNGDTTGTMTYDYVVGNLINLENIRTFYMERLGMKDIGISQNSSISGTYKTNIYVSNTGLSAFEDDWAYMSTDAQQFAYLFVAPGAMRVDEPSWVLPHELAHAFTYHQGGTINYAWYEAVANWFRDQYLGSEYYAYGGKVYGPTSDFFAPYLLNSQYYVPHMLNWYDTWPILLYISENPDNINGLGMDCMHKIFEYNGAEANMYDVIESCSGVSIKTILAGLTRRLATMDFSRQESYLNRLNNEVLTVSGNYEKIYSTLGSRDSAGFQTVSDDRMPMQTGFNIIPLDVDLSKDYVNVDFVSTSKVSGADFRTSIVTATADNKTRYSNIVSGNGTASISLNGDETKAYLVVCATPDTLKKYEVDWNSSADDVDTRYTYKVKVTTGTNAAVIPDPTPEVNPIPETDQAVTSYKFNPSKGLSNSYFTASGSIVTNAGTAVIKSTTLKSALKMNSKGKISFTTTKDGAKLTVIAKSKSSTASLKVNGKEQIKNLTASCNTFEVTLGAKGTYIITKGKNESYIFYVIVEE